MNPTPPLPEAITLRILSIRGQRVIVDADLAALYDVPTKRFNEAIKRNLAKFPADFMFVLTDEEFAALRSQFATSNNKRGGRRYAPLVFTEHGALMAAMLINSPRAVEISVYVVRAFVQLRELVSSHRELAKHLDNLEQKSPSPRLPTRRLQPQHPHPAETSLRGTTRTHDPTRPTETTDRICAP